MVFDHEVVTRAQFQLRDQSTLHPFGVRTSHDVARPMLVAHAAVPDNGHGLRSCTYEHRRALWAIRSASARSSCAFGLSSERVGAEP